MPKALSPLGLDQPRAPSWGEDFDNFLVRCLGKPHYIREGRDAFEALVPDRFKTPAPMKVPE